VTKNVEQIPPLNKKEELSLSANNSPIKTLGILLFVIIITLGLSLAVLKAKKH